MTTRRIALFAFALAVAVALAACSDAGSDNASEGEPPTNASENERQTKASGDACEPARFAPTYLPWEKSGSIPKPEKLKNERDTILLWFGRFQDGQPTAKADLATHYESTDKGGEVVPVRGTEGRLSWTGGSAQEWGLRWTERDEPCGHYGLYFTDLNISKAQAKAEIVRIAESLR